MANSNNSVIQRLPRGTIQKPLRTYGARVFSFCPLGKANFERFQNEKTFSIISRRFLCPGLDSFHPESQYFVSAVCQICVVKLNRNQIASFYNHFFTLLFVFRPKIYFT